MSKIARVSAYALCYPEPNDAMNMRSIALARIETDDGAVGWGEAVTIWEPASRATAQLIEDAFAPLLIGRDPVDNYPLWLEMKEHCWWWGDTGLALFAVSALDMALWDVKGKILGQPLHKMLGGKLFSRLRACASTHPAKASIDDLAQEMADHVANGYTAVKAGFGKKGDANLGVDPVRDLAYVKAVREAVGPHVDWVPDLGKKTRWDAAMAVKMTRQFEEYNIRWIEDPLLPENIEGYQKLRASVHTPVATGERAWTVADYRRFIAAGAADVYLVDAGRVEGVTGYKQVIELTAAHHTFINAHTWAGALLHAASIHLTAVSPNHIFFEVKPTPNPMQHELARNFDELAAVNGWVNVPDTPGLGVEIDERVIAKYSC